MKARRIQSTTYGLGFAIVAALISINGLRAHEGHDHGGPKIEITTAVAPRFDAVSDDFELVGVVKGKDLIVYLDRFRTNEQIPAAKITATANGEPVPVEPLDDKSYRIRTPLLASPGKIDFQFTIVDGDLTDLLAGSLEATGPKGASVSTQTWGETFTQNRSAVIAGLAGFMLGVSSILLFRTGRGRTASDAQYTVDVSADQTQQSTVGDKPLAIIRRVVSALALAVAVSLLGPVGVDAQEATAPAKIQLTITADLPQRLSDGSLFVPKETQHLLTIRTVLAGESSAARTAQLSGQVVADPNGFGRVQSPVDGRIEALEVGLPFVGQKVVKGQVLVNVTPVIPTADQNSYAGTIGELDTQILLAEQKLARISRIPGTIPQKDIDDTKTTVDGLRKRRASVRSSQGEPQPLTAPITGVIAMSAAVPGQLASARDVIFEIVDPTRLWLEAIAFDPRIVSDIVEASAVTTTGETFKLNFVGRSLTLRQQGTPVNFSVEAPTETLAIGRPMTVILKTASKRDGMILPQAAVVRGANGVSIIWTHVAAERFKPNIVKLQPLDGERVVIEGGLKPNERAVIEGATLLNQIR
jgi:membrane fusion protein, heavy metal efflux system